MEQAQHEIRFVERWDHHTRRCLLLLAVDGQNDQRLAELKHKWEMVQYFTQHLLKTHGTEEPTVPKTRRGRKEKYDWSGAKQHVFQLLEEHGAPSVDDPDWSSQADVERAIAEFFQTQYGHEPAVSGVRLHAKEFLNEWLQARRR